jgi:stage IV sporulation protein FB
VGLTSYHQAWYYSSKGGGRSFDVSLASSVHSRFNLFLAEPPPTPWDLHFRILGIPVRISAWFWLGNVLLGWNFAVGVSRGTAGTVSTGVALLIWTVAVLISILVHELGHALTYRYFGVPSHIVLYHFGGLAIADRGFGSYGRHVGEDPRRQILISLAGPAAQMVFAILVIGGILFAGRSFMHLFLSASFGL